MKSNEDLDIRWEQRFSNFEKALQKLTEAIELVQASENSNRSQFIESINYEKLDEIIKEGLIQRFEYTYEMAWNVMKDYASYQGINDLTGSRDAIRFAFSAKLISDGESWMEMIKSRVLTTHTYNEATANEVFTKVVSIFYPCFIEFQKTMTSKKSA